jgi:TetR/AcrR family transcriptional regulator
MDNRANILLCALKLFAARGYDGTGVQEIVDTAGITKPTLYHYFGNKEGLLTALLEEYFTRLCERLAVAADYQGDITKTLTSLVEAYYAFAHAHQDFYRFHVSLMYAAPDSPAYKIAARFEEKPVKLLEALFLQAVRDHGNMRGRHTLYAATFLGFIQAYVGNVLAGKFEHKADLTYRALHQYMHGIFS